MREKKLFLSFFKFFGFLLRFFWDFCVAFIRIFRIFLDFRICSFFFFHFLWIPYTATKVTTKSYQGYCWKPKWAKTSYYGLFMPDGPKKTSAKALRRPYLLVLVKEGWTYTSEMDFRLLARQPPFQGHTARSLARRCTSLEHRKIINIEGLDAIRISG